MQWRDKQQEGCIVVNLLPFILRRCSHTPHSDSVTTSTASDVLTLLALDVTIKTIFKVSIFLCKADVCVLTAMNIFFQYLHGSKG